MHTEPKFGIELARFILANGAEIKSVMAKKGGVNVQQTLKKTKNRSTQFQFFSSAYCLARQYEPSNKKLFFSFAINKNNKSTQIHQDQYQAMAVLQNHLSIFNNIGEKIDLIKRIETSALYSPLANELNKIKHGNETQLYDFNSDKNSLSEQTYQGNTADHLLY